MLLGLVLISVPLLVAILNAGLQMRALSETSERLVVEVVGAARASQNLFAQIGGLERTARSKRVDVESQHVERGVFESAPGARDLP